MLSNRDSRRRGSVAQPERQSRSPHHPLIPVKFQIRFQSLSRPGGPLRLAGGPLQTQPLTTPGPKAVGLIASMSRRGNWHDNTSIKSFWSPLKPELLYRGKFTSHAHARSVSFDKIEFLYNRQRRHTSLEGPSPVQFGLKNDRLSPHFYRSGGSKQTRAPPALQKKPGCHGDTPALVAPTIG